MLITLYQNQFLEEDGEIIFLCCTVSLSASLSLCQCSINSKTQLCFHFKQCECCTKGDQTDASLHQMSALSDKMFYSPNKV